MKNYTLISLFIIWLEINVTGKIYMPEFFCIILMTCGLIYYMFWRLIWLILTLEIKKIGKEKDSM